MPRHALMMLPAAKAQSLTVEPFAPGGQFPAVSNDAWIKGKTVDPDVSISVKAVPKFVLCWSYVRV
jgi:hypothetical protein